MTGRSKWTVCSLLIFCINWSSELQWGHKCIFLFIHPLNLQSDGGKSKSSSVLKTCWITFGTNQVLPVAVDETCTTSGRHFVLFFLTLVLLLLLEDVLSNTWSASRQVWALTWSIQKEDFVFYCLTLINLGIHFRRPGPDAAKQTQIMTLTPLCSLFLRFENLWFCVKERKKI